MSIPGYAIDRESEHFVVLKGLNCFTMGEADMLLEKGLVFLQSDAPYPFQDVFVSCIRLGSLKDALALPTLAAPQPPVLLPDPPSHEQGYANNLTEALRERDKYRQALVEIADKSVDPEISAYAQLVLDGVL